MQRLFFHIRDSDTRIEDLEGQEFPDLDAARKEAIESAREILAERIRNGQKVDGSRFEIADETGQVLATVAFADTFKLS